MAPSVPPRRGARHRSCERGGRNGCCGNFAGGIHHGGGLLPRRDALEPAHGPGDPVGHRIRERQRQRAVVSGHVREELSLRHACVPDGDTREWIHLHRLEWSLFGNRRMQPRHLLRRSCKGNLHQERIAIVAGARSALPAVTRKRRKVFLKKAHAGKSMTVPGTLTFHAQCDQSAAATLLGTLSETTVKRVKGRLRKTTVRFKLGPAHAAIGAGTPAVRRLRLTAAALHGLASNARESAVVTLTASNGNGRTQVTLMIPRIHAA